LILGSFTKIGCHISVLVKIRRIKKMEILYEDLHDFCTRVVEENEAYISHAIHFSINVLPFKVIKKWCDQPTIAMLCIYL
jgi:hypothetical protein